MKFQEAFDAVFDVMSAIEKGKGMTFAVQPQTVKILAFLWSMLAVSQNVLDDCARIGNNNEIISFPIPGEKSTQKTPKGKPVDNAQNKEKQATESAE